MAHARNTDPSTSHAAAQSVHESWSAVLRGRVLALLDLGAGYTDEELADAYWLRYDEPATPSGLRTRRAELVTAGMVADSGERRPTRGGRAAIVWEAAFTCGHCLGYKPLRDAHERVDVEGNLWCQECAA